ncbi:MAG: hypothetical protein ACFE8M_00635 [Candidatus Hermodarchaeota archaeon]
MEIEKTRETSWKIRLKKDNENIELTSVEISGEVRLIKLSLIKDDNSLVVEMNKEEFFNFLSLIGAFKDVVIGGDSFISEEELNPPEIQKTSDDQDNNEDLYPLESESSEKLIKEEELNPEEWDPW